MKNFVLLLIALVIFLICGLLGFQLAARVTGGMAANSPALPGGSTADHLVQHNWLVIEVDQIGTKEPGNAPRLLSIWFVMLNMEFDPPMLVFAQLYPGQPGSKTAQQLARTFALNARGEPGDAFWKTLAAMDLSVTDFVILDPLAFNQVEQWLGGQFGSPIQSEPHSNRVAFFELVKRNCEALPGLTLDDDLPRWGELIPNHFHTNLRLDTALLDWQKITNPEKPVDCQVILR